MPYNILDIAYWTLDDQTWLQLYTVYRCIQKVNAKTSPAFDLEIT